LFLHIAAKCFFKVEKPDGLAGLQYNALADIIVFFPRTVLPRFDTSAFGPREKRGNEFAERFPSAEINDTSGLIFLKVSVSP
jgi:hypothetical protein